MADVECQLWGEPIAIQELTLRAATAMAQALQEHPFATLVETRAQDTQQGVVFDLQVDLPQRPPVPIQPTERILVRFETDETKPPAISPLRVDFPDVPHMNLTPRSALKELCLFDEPYSEIRLRLTPRLLIDRIAGWLARAATEELHLKEQPLEPLILSADRLILDYLRQPLSTEAIYAIELLAKDPFIAAAMELSEETARKFKNDVPLHLLLFLEASPWHARSINYQPENFCELAEMLRPLGIDLSGQCCALVWRIYDQKKLDLFRRGHVFVLLKLPKTRTSGGPVESTEWWAFMLTATVEETALRLGCLAKDGDRLGRMLEAIPDKAESIGVLPFRPTLPLRKSYAQLLSGGIVDDPKVVAVGTGALGSQSILALARQGFGTWTVIDDDRLLPHNLQRHALLSHHIGCNKAEALADELRRMLGDAGVAQAIPANVLHPQQHREQMTKAIVSADVVLDFAASDAVSSHLALFDASAPRLSAYLGPEARFSFLLWEGQDRRVRLDDLEIQMKVAITESERLEKSLLWSGKSVSYAAACRDSSVQLPQEIVALHAATIASFVKHHALSVEPAIHIWEWSASALALSHYAVPIRDSLLVREGDWTVRISAHATDFMRFCRRRRLPNETGGVLIGRINPLHKIIYVGMALPSPSDSVEWPTVYIRGCAGLREQVERVQMISGGDLMYVGEWHSHPVGIAGTPSEADRAAHVSLSAEMSKAGWPGMVLIQADERTPTLLLETAGL